MEKIEKIVRYSKLLSLYQALLSNTQKEVLNDYYLLDLSLSEIAENRGISRSGVEDALNKGNKKLEELEVAMRLLEKEDKIRARLNDLKRRTLNYKEVKEIEDLERILDYGI